MTDEADRPHVVMLVANDVRTDSRVRKAAVSAARAGARVTLLGLSIDGDWEESRLGDVHLIRVATPLVYTKGVSARRRRLRRGRRLTGYASLPELRVARLRADLAAADASYARGKQRRGRARVLALLAKKRRLVTRVRAAAQRRIDRAQRFVWHGYDGVVNRTPVFVSWRRVLPEVVDYEMALGPVIDDLAPDLIHAHDAHVLPTAVHASSRAARGGRRVPVLYDAHEFVPGMARYGPRTPRVLAGWTRLEDEFARDVDAVITVSPAIADAIQSRYKLDDRPTVVLNTPLAAEASATSDTDVRAAAGVAADVPLLVYSGGITAARGVGDIVCALPLLPGVHLAVVAVPHPRTQPALALQEEADRLGVADRLHLVEAVAPDQVVPFLRTADVGVHSLLRYPNHDMALPNKLFEYLHAGLPLVVSDVPTMAAFVQTHGLGRSYVAGDATTLAAAVQEVLDNREAYAEAARSPQLRAENSWQAQERGMHELYRRLLPGLAPAAADQAFPPLVERPYRVERDGRLLLGIGPANMAGQGWAWCRAAERHLPDVDALTFAVERDGLNFPSDVLIDRGDYANSTAWQMRWAGRLRRELTHVLMEAGRPVFGRLNGTTFAADVPALRESGITVGLVFHGSEIRDPRRHAARYEWSPFGDPGDELTARLQRQVDELAPIVAAFDGPKFVSTHDLLDDVADAVWLPVVVDVDAWHPGEAPLRRPRPVVVHAPSNPALKGTLRIEPVLEQMHEEGVIEYRRIQGIPPLELPGLVRDADIVLDHFGIGNYGVVTCEAMASGRVSISHIHDRVRSRMPDPIPTIEATPDTLRGVIEQVLDDRDAARELAATGPGFVRRWHDGRASAAVLAQFLGRELPAG